MRRSRGWPNFISGCYFRTCCDDLLDACDGKTTLLTCDSVSFTEIHKWTKKLLQCKFGFKMSEPQIDESACSGLVIALHNKCITATTMVFVTFAMNNDDDDAFYYSISEHRQEMKRLHPPLSLAVCSI